jgi:hypothetical protein
MQQPDRRSYFRCHQSKGSFRRRKTTVHTTAVMSIPSTAPVRLSLCTGSTQIYLFTLSGAHLPALCLDLHPWNTAQHGKTPTTCPACVASIMLITLTVDERCVFCQFFFLVSQALNKNKIYHLPSSDTQIRASCCQHKSASLRCHSHGWSSIQKSPLGQ